MILYLMRHGPAAQTSPDGTDRTRPLTEKQVADIAKQKMPDLNAASLDAAIKSVKGTARSMGIEVGG